MSTTEHHSPQVAEVERLVGEGLAPLAEQFAACGVRKSTFQLVRYAVSKKVEAIKVGGQWQTSRAAVLRFLARNTAEARGETVKPSPSPSRRASRRAAKRYLEAAGGTS